MRTTRLRGIRGGGVYNCSMDVRFRLLGVCAFAAIALRGQTLSNKSLTGKYFFREVLLATDSMQTLTFAGTMTFDGNGNVSIAGLSLAGTSTPTSASSTGTYAVAAGGSVTITDPLRNGATINARLGQSALAGSNTETGNNVFSIFVAMSAATSSVSTSTLNGTYWIASLEFLNGSPSSTSETFFTATADGHGGFGNPSVFGEASNLGDEQATQIVTGATYTVNADGSGTAVFPVPTGADPTMQLLSGTKNIYISQDGSFFFGGSTAAGGQGLLIGIQAGSSVTNTGFTGLYWSADLFLEQQTHASYTGSAYALGANGSFTASRRERTDGGVLDVTADVPYAIGNPYGSGTAIDNDIAVSANGQVFLGSGLSFVNTDRYELFFGIRAPSVSGPGMFLNPQGVFNVFSFAPAGNPIAPGEFITIYGTGLPAQSAVSVPFPIQLGGVELLINNTPAPLYLITATQVFAAVPYSVTGPTASIVLNSHGTLSNTINVPLAASAPGIATVSQNGIGAGAITHADGTLVSSTSPASPGETVVIYLTGLGQVSPAIGDGAAATGLRTTNSVQTIYFNGVCANAPNCDASNIAYQGLTPGYAGLYQINVTIPIDVTPGLAVPLAIQTANGFTDMVNIAIQ